jgi:hypothetical protein
VSVARSRRALFNEANAMLSRSRNKLERHAVLHRTVKEFIVAGNNDLAWDYYVKTIDRHDKIFIMQCYAKESMLAGNEQDTENLLQQDIDWAERDVILSEMIFFHASNNNTSAVDRIFQEGVTANENSTMTKSMIFGFVKNTHYGSLKKIIDAIQNETDKLQIYSHIVKAICEYVKFNEIIQFAFLFADRNDESTFLQLLANKFMQDNNSKGVFKILNTFYNRPYGLRLSQLIMYDMAFFGRMNDLTVLINTAPDGIRKDLYPSMAKGFVNGDKIDNGIIIYKSIETPDDARLVASSLVIWTSKDGDWASLLKILIAAKRYRAQLYQYIDSVIFNQGDFSTVDFAIDTMARIHDPELRQTLTRKLAACKGMPENVLVHKVDKLHFLMGLHIPNKIVIEWVKLTPVTQLFLLSFHLFANKKCKPSSALRIASYLSPMPAGIQGRDLANYLNDHYYKKRVNNHFSTQHTLFFEKILPFREFNRQGHKRTLKM